MPRDATVPGVRVDRLLEDGDQGVSYFSHNTEGHTKDLQNRRPEKRDQIRLRKRDLFLGKSEVTGLFVCIMLGGDGKYRACKQTTGGIQVGIPKLSVDRHSKGIC